jgi:pimeloyl-ACP methyl ester carboxylesterase
MIETALQFGPENNLVGVLTSPAASRTSLGVLILTSGVVHRIGPHRVSVKLARHLAQLGYQCMRFDVSGVGDSRMPAGAADFRLQDVRDTTAAMDWLERERGIRQFALFGICSGAVNAYSTALADARVSAVFMLDGFIYPTRKGRINYYRTKLRALGLAKACRMAAARLWQRLSASKEQRQRAPDAAASKVRNPTPEEFGTGIQGLTDRGVRVALMFTGSVLNEYSYAGQLRETFPTHAFLEKITCHFAPDMDHTLTSIASQRRLVDLATHWVQEAGAADAVSGVVVRGDRTVVAAGAPP